MIVISLIYKVDLLVFSVHSVWRFRFETELRVTVGSSLNINGSVIAIDYQPVHCSDILWSFAVMWQ